jgi:hypothetical protein
MHERLETEVVAAEAAARTRSGEITTAGAGAFKAKPFDTARCREYLVSQQALKLRRTVQIAGRTAYWPLGGKV